MPESAEVKLTVDFLNSAITGKIIRGWHFTNGQYLHEDPTGFEEFYDNLPVFVEEVSCKGKFIYITCFNEYKIFYILHSMMLAGNWQNSEDSHCRWFIELQDGKKIWFHDSCCFATLKFTTDKQELDDYLAKLGPDILSEEFSIPVWRKLLQKYKNKNITSFLMDQEIISGCGNYIKAEALYYAKISPLRKVGSLTEKEADQLFDGLRLIPRQSYMNKGYDHKGKNGKKGFHEFHLKIYGKDTAKKTKTADGRMTYWDDKVQN